MDEKDRQELAEDAAVARVRAADPAATAVPDTEALRAVVDERRAEPIGVVPDELAARRARRWTGWPAKVAGVAAAALLVGSGGYAIGAAGDGGAGDVVADGGAEAAMTLQVPGAENSAGDDTQSAPEVAPVAPGERMGMGQSDAAYWGGWGRTVFTASGLSDQGTTLHAWALDAASAFTEQTIAAAAAALGIAGTPQLVDGSWVVGPNDGIGPTAQMYPDGTASINYWDPTKDVWNCPVTYDGEESSKASGDTGTAVEPPVPDPCQPRDLGPAPQGDAAKAVLRDLLTAMGQDPAGYELVVENYGDESQDYAYVTAYQVLNDQRTGLSWSTTLTGAGVASLYGSTAPLVDMGEYQVVSPVEAVARLGDPRFGAGYGGPLYYAAREGGGVADAGTSDTQVAPAPDEPGAPTVPPTAAAGSRISWPVAQATIVSARLGLAQQWQPDGSVVLVPTYELTSDEGAVWSVIAVADAHLDFSAVG